MTRTDTDLVAAALVFMAQATAFATSTRDRQLVAIATAYQAGETDRVNALAREHLVDYPDSVLVSWIALIAASSVPDRNPQEKS